MALITGPLRLMRAGRAGRKCATAGGEHTNNRTLDAVSRAINVLRFDYPGELGTKVIIPAWAGGKSFREHLPAAVGDQGTTAGMASVKHGRKIG